ncbi:MAG: D-alanyl-D-alanine carboxypeptidase family protein [Hyphomicrobiales bacterium]
MAALRRKAIAVCLALLFTAPSALGGPTLVFDAGTGEVISQDRAGEPWYPASLTKLMTSYVVFQKIKAGTLKLDQKVTVSELAARQPPSKLGMRAGSEITVDLALQVLLVYSANDMAYVLAEAAGGTAQNFVQEMNANARRLGMTATYFANPNGLFDPRQVTTARDIGLLAATIRKEFPEYAHYFAEPYVAVGKRRLMNRNALIRQMNNADGMKTGFVCNSGYNLVASASDDGRKAIAVILGASSGKARSDLAQMLLTSALSRLELSATPEPRPRLETIPNSALGKLVPADLTTLVCKGKGATLARASTLSGWGISLGRYDTALTADMALRGRLLGAREILAGGSSGVVKDPSGQGFSAMVWDLDQTSSLSLCGFFREQSAYCEVMTPEGFAAIAAIAAASEKTPPVSQGDDSAPPRKKRKAKKK